MCRKFTITPSKTYATEENADKAVQKIFGDNKELRYFIMRTAEGRFFPVFVGESAALDGVHFHFNIVG